MPRRRSTPTAAIIRALFPTVRRPTRKASRRRIVKKPVAPGVSRTRPGRKVRPPIEDGTWRSYRYSGAEGSRPYYLYVPRGLPKSQPVPLLIALHGCGQGAAEFAAATRANRLADTHRFIVAYPEQLMAHNAQRCWNWFRPGHQHRGVGEPAILAGIVRQIAESTGHARVDTARVYVFGLSAGGAMSAVLAATYPELFAAVGIHSAPPYASATTVLKAQRAMSGLTPPPPGPPPMARPMPPMIIFQGTRDHVVSSSCAERQAHQWLAYNENAVEARRVTRTRTSVGAPSVSNAATARRGHRVQRWYNAGGKKMLELWTVDGLGHAWSGGAAHGSYSDPRGPRATTEMWRFFSLHSA